MIRLLLCIAIIMAAITASARNTDTMTGIFNDRVKTLQVRGADGNIFTPPVVMLGAGDFLNISFDHLSDDRQYLRWRVLRCDANWQPSQLV